VFNGGNKMKAASILMKEGEFRDADGIPNFQSVIEIGAYFSPQEIVIMVNHFLMRREDWEKVNTKKFMGEPHSKSVVGAWTKLKPGVPLRKQLTTK
jgi:hypothetical protein